MSLVSMPSSRAPKFSRRLSAAVATALAVGMLALSVPMGASAAPPTNGPVKSAAANATQTIQVNVDAFHAGGNVPGVQFKLFNPNAQDTGPGTAVADAWGTCTTTAAGTCTFSVPSSGSGNGGTPGANFNKRFWVQAVTAPAGWYLNPTLITGNNTNDGSERFAQTPYTFRTEPMDGTGTIQVPNLDDMPDEALIGPPLNTTGDTGDRWKTGGDFVVSKSNNRYSNQTCNTGPKIAILLDLSTSMTYNGNAGINGAKTAAKQFVTALADTGSGVALFTFGTDAPKSGGSGGQNYALQTVTSANLATFTSRIDGYQAGGDPAQYTNWDEGIRQIANSATTFDIVIVLTDGNPTVYEDSGTGGWTTFRHVEEAVLSANALKAKGSQILAFGVGDGISQVTADNLRAISGITEWTGSGSIANADYTKTNDWNLVGTQLKALAAGVTCTVPITVIKQEKLLDGSTKAGAGWKFTATNNGAGTLTPAGQQTTSANGTVNWELKFANPGDTGSVTITEASGGASWQLASVTCLNNGQAFYSGTSATFQLTGLKKADNIVCTVVNQQLQAGVKVEKVWIVDGVTYPNGQQLPSSLAAQLQLSGTNQAWGVVRNYTIGNTAAIKESTSGLPALCTLTSATLSGNGASNVDVKDKTFTTPALAAGTVSYTITNVVTCTSELVLKKVVVNDNGGTATSADWKLTYAPGGTSGVASGTVSVVAAGTYTIGEKDGPSGYTLTGVVCDQPYSNGQVTVPKGVKVTCTFTNDDVAPTLTLEKVVQGAPGVAPGNWKLTAKDGGTTVLTGNGGATGTVKANVPFTLSETPAPGFTLADQFTASAWECQTNGTGPWTTLTNGALPGLKLDDDVLCRIVNTAKSATPTIVKDVVSNTANADGTWTIVYNVTVTNPSKLVGLTYDLSDTLDYGTGISTSASATGPSPQAGSWTGSGLLADDVALGKESSHVYVVTVVATLAAGIQTSELACPTGPGDGGFMNRVVLTVDGKTYPEDACARPELPTFSKSPSATAPVSNADGTWTVTYDLKVTNPSNQQLFYSLSDTPNLPSGVTLVSSSVTGPVTATGTIPGVLFSGASIAAGATHDFVVTLTVKVASTVPVGDLACTAGKGLDNDAVVTSSNQQLPDDACVSITPPTVVHDKTVTSTTQNPDGTWTIVYDVAVTNPGNVNGVYSLVDVPKVSVPNVLTLVSATATGPTAQAATWNGVDSTSLAVDHPILAGATQHFTITLTVAVAAGKIADPLAKCAADGGTNGFLNTTKLTVNGVVTEDSACSTPSQPDLVKDFVAAEPTGPGTWSVSYTITVSNTDAGAKDAYYTLSDALGFPSGVTTGTPVVTLTSADPDVDVPWNDGALVSTPRLLAAGATDVYLLVVEATVPVGTGDLTCTNESGHGFYNSSTVLTGADTLVSADCGSVTESVVPTIVKDVAPGYPKQQADGTWLIRYTITVANPSTALAAKYSLSDEFQFGAGILISMSPAATITGPVATNPAWNGVGVTSVVSDVTLPKDSQHVYTVEVTATVPDGVYGEHDECLESKEDGGFLNVATITSGPVTRSDDACAPPARPTIEKVVDPGNQPKLTDSGAWLVTYLLTVTNDSPLQVAYDLFDAFEMAEGLTLSNAKVTSGDAAVDPSWDGVIDTEVTDGTQLLAGNSTDVFTVTVLVTVENDYDVDDECTGKPGHGLFNGAELSSLGVVYDEDDACAELPIAELTLVKEVDNSEFDGLDLDGHTLADTDDWTLSATGDEVTVEGTSGTSEVTTVLVPAGTYALDEAVADDAGSDLLDYYTAGDWTCDDAEGDSVTLADGDSVTCTIVNTGHPVDLSIDKDDAGVVIDEGETYEYTFTVANNGETGTKETVVTDVIPSTLKVSLPFLTVPADWTVELDGEDADGFGGTLTLTRAGTFPAGDSVEFVFEVTAAEVLPREGGGTTGKILDIVNTATVGSDGVEVDPSDNTSTEVTPVKSLVITIGAQCTLNAPYATWSITSQNTDSISGATVALIWWTPEAYAARDLTIDASDTAALLADGAIAVNPITAPPGGWVTGATLTGSQLWPGAAVNASGSGTAWPGWKLVNGIWVLDPTSPTYPIRDGAIVEVRMNPTTGAATAYPGAFGACKPFSFPDLPTLALTGAGWLGGSLLLANALVVLGIVVMAMRGRRSTHRA